MGKHLLLAGGGHAHLPALLAVRDFTDRGHRVTLVTPSPYHYYSGMGPGLLGGFYQPEDTRFHVRRMVEERGGTFVADRVVRIEAARRRVLLASGAELAYDLLSCNTGSGIAASGLAPEEDRHIAVKPIENLHAARRTILERLPERLRLLVVGGGPAGVEIAGNLWRLAPENRESLAITLVAGERLLPGLPRRVGDLARTSLDGRGIEVIEGRRVARLEEGEAVLDDGSRRVFDLAFLATGVKPHRLFTDSGLPTGPAGGLQVNACLQCTGDPLIFGGGDCVSLGDPPLPRVGVFAVRQGPVLRDNLLAALEGKELKRFEPQEKYLLILNLGDGTGIAARGRLVWNGALAFRLKDWIDRRFMRKYQVSGEKNEPGLNP